MLYMSNRKERQNKIYMYKSYRKEMQNSPEADPQIETLGVIDQKKKKKNLHLFSHEACCFLCWLASRNNICPCTRAVFGSCTLAQVDFNNNP